MAPVQSWFKGIQIDTQVNGFDEAARKDFFNRTQRDLMKISSTSIGAFPDDHTHVTSLLQPLAALRPMGYWLCSALQPLVD